MKEAISRLNKRLAGLLATRLDQLNFEGLRDPRKGKTMWPIRKLLTTVAVGMAAGCKSLAETETLSSKFSRSTRRRLGILRRVPDTTMRDLLLALEPSEIRKLLRQLIKTALRSKQIVHHFPLRVASLDGKGTSSWLLDGNAYPENYGQINSKTGRATVRTITACLPFASGVPCIDAHPIPAETNECGVFQGAVDGLLTAYGRSLFDVVLYDSGAASLENANYLRANELDYVFCLTDGQPTLRAEAERLLGRAPTETRLAQTVDRDGSERVTRSIWLTDNMKSWLDWTHLQTVVRIECVREDALLGTRTVENRYYISSLKPQSLTAQQWLDLIRRRWAVENECHNTFDRIFEEDKRPWVLQPRAMVVVQLLRRLVYTMLSVFRSVTQRSDEKRQTPWKSLLGDIADMLKNLVEEAMAGVRRRTVATS